MSCSSNNDCSSNRYCDGNKCVDRKWYHYIPLKTSIICASIFFGLMIVVIITRKTLPDFINKYQLVIVFILLIVMLIPIIMYIHNKTKKPECPSNIAKCGPNGVATCDSDLNWNCEYSNANNVCKNQSIPYNCGNNQYQVLNSFCEPVCVAEIKSCSNDTNTDCKKTPEEVSNIHGKYDGNTYCDTITGQQKCNIICDVDKITKTTCGNDEISTCSYDFESGMYKSICVKHSSSKCDGQTTSCGGADSVCVQDPNTGAWGLICMENPSINDLEVVYGIQPKQAKMVDNSGAQIDCKQDSDCINSIKYSDEKNAPNWNKNLVKCDNGLCRSTFYTNSSGVPIWPTVTESAGSVFSCSTDLFHRGYGKSVIRNPPGFVPKDT